MKLRPSLVAVLACAAALGACATRESGSVYSRHETGREQTVRFATVESVRSVKIAGGQSQVGPIAGGAVGGIAGSEVGHGKGSAIGAVLGAVGGGVAGAVLGRNIGDHNRLVTVLGAAGGALLGNQIEKQARATKHWELTVNFDDGTTQTLSSEAQPFWHQGDRVRLYEGRLQPV